MVGQIVIPLDDELAKEMSKHPDVDWVKTVQFLLKECLERKEIAEMYCSKIKNL